MHLDRRLLGWGMFFILLGAVPLAVRAAAVDADLVGRWPTLWPLLLIGWGLGLVFRATPVEWVGGALTAITFGLMGGGAIATGFSGVPALSSCSSGGGQAFAAQHGTFPGAGRIEIELSCGSLAVTTASGSDWQATGTDDGGRGPKVSVAPDGSVTLKTDEGPSIVGGRSTWDVTLPQASHLTLGVTLNAGAGSVDLSGAAIDALNVTLNAGSMDVDLASAEGLPRDGLNLTVNAGKATLSLPSFDGSMNLSLNAGSLTVCAPTGTPLRVRWSGTLASNDLADAGLVKGPDDTWTTPGLEAAAAHVELAVSANAGSFNLQLGGTCRA